MDQTEPLHMQHGLEVSGLPWLRWSLSTTVKSELSLATTHTRLLQQRPQDLRTCSSTSSLGAKAVERRCLAPQAARTQQSGVPNVCSLPG